MLFRSDQTCYRKVWRCRDVCEQVPCVSHVKVCAHAKVPYTVCKKVPYTVCKKVPYTVCKMVKECKKEPYTVCRVVKEVVREQVPYTVSRNVTGAYVDEKGVGGPAGAAYECEGPGRVFKEGAQISKEVCHTTCRMVAETCTKKVPCTCWRTVSEDCVKKVPCTTCTMQKIGRAHV